MYAVISPSENTTPASGVVPLRRWADGVAEVSFAQVEGETRLRHLYQSDPCRILFPRNTDGAPKEAVIVTTSGGIVGGDRLRFEIAAEAGCIATVTTQAAEKIYRTAGANSEIHVTVNAVDCDFLEWVPQETILFDGARLRRRTSLDSGTDKTHTDPVLTMASHSAASDSSNCALVAGSRSLSLTSAALCAC